MDHRLDRRDRQCTAQVGTRKHRSADQGKAAGQCGEPLPCAVGQSDTVQADHVAPRAQQMLHDVQRDEPGGAGDQYGHAAIIHAWSQQTTAASRAFSGLLES
jgi:hypothetical protein